MQMVVVVQWHQLLQLMVLLLLFLLIHLQNQDIHLQVGLQIVMVVMMDMVGQIGQEHGNM